MSGFPKAEIKNEGGVVPRSTDLRTPEDERASHYAAHSLAIACSWIDNAYDRKGAVLPGTTLDYELTEIRSKLKSLAKSLNGEKEPNPVMQKFLKDTDQDHG